MRSARFGQPQCLLGCYTSAMPDSEPDDPAVHEETDNPKYADDRMFYKLEKWTSDGTTVDRLLYAGNSLAKARAAFDEAIKHRPRIRLTIRQRTRVLQQWPRPPAPPSVA
jgi:hypothetical protein